MVFMMRIAEIERKTAETVIIVKIGLDGRPPVGVEDNGTVIDGVIRTGIGFLDHMLTLFGFHGGFALSVTAKGDTGVDFHHTTEDVGVVLGQCIKKALGDARGITRYASVFLPMDEALALVALDIGGRTYLNYDVKIDAPKVGDFDTELAEEFLSGFCRSLGLTLHVKMLYGSNAHHIIEAIFKGLGRALGEAVRPDPRANGSIPSTKGVITS